jgi:hypothetical protein
MHIGPLEVEGNGCGHFEELRASHQLQNILVIVPLELESQG